MEKGAGGGGDAARTVGMCDRLLTFFTKNLPVNRQKTITEGPRDGGGSHQKNQAEEDDEFEVKIEKADFELSREEEHHRSVAATVLEERNTGASTARASDQQRQKEAIAEAGREVATAAAAAVVPQEEKKVRKSVTIKEEAAGGDKDKKSLLKKRQAAPAASSGGQVGAAGGEDPKPRWALRPRMPSIMRVPSNINEKSTNFIQESKRRFGGGKPEKSTPI